MCKKDNQVLWDGRETKEGEKVRGKDGRKPCYLPGWNEHRIMLLYDEILHFLGCDNRAFVIVQPCESCKEGLPAINANPCCNFYINRFYLSAPSLQNQAVKCVHRAVQMLPRSHLGAWFRCSFCSDLGNGFWECVGSPIG